MFCDFFHIIKGIGLSPFILIPDFNAASNTYKHGILFDACKFP